MIDALPDRPLTDAEVQTLDQQFYDVTGHVTLPHSDGDTGDALLTLRTGEDSPTYVIGYAPDEGWGKSHILDSEPELQEIALARSNYYAEYGTPDHPIPESRFREKMIESAAPHPTIIPVAGAEHPCLDDPSHDHLYIYQQIMRHYGDLSVLTYSNEVGNWTVSNIVENEDFGIETHNQALDTCRLENERIHKKHGLDSVMDRFGDLIPTGEQ